MQFYLYDDIVIERKEKRNKCFPIQYSYAYIKVINMLIKNFSNIKLYFNFIQHFPNLIHSAYGTLTGACPRDHHAAYQAQPA